MKKFYVLPACLLIAILVLSGGYRRPSVPLQTVVRDGFTVVEGPQIANMRDLGSLKTADGRALRRGRIYRSAALDYSGVHWYRRNWILPAESRDYLVNKIGIKTDVDLRRDGEEIHFRTNSPLGLAVKWVHVPSKSYDSLGKAEGRAAFQQVFETFLDEANYPIDFHCRLGRDRAGAVAYILEALLGVSDDDKRRDWEYTERAKGKTAFDYGKIGRLLQVFDAYPGATRNEKVAAYVKSLGFTEGDLAKFRSFMVEK